MINRSWKKPIEERVELFRRYYARKNERPLLGFFCGSEFPLRRYPASQSLPESRPLTPDDFEVERYFDDCDKLFEAHEQCGGDFIWSATSFWAVPWLEVALGCEIIADHATGSIYSKAPEDFSGANSIPVFDANNPWMRKSVEFIKKIAEFSGGRWPLATTRMRGVSDLLSALYGANEMVFAMLERPDDIKAAAEKLTDFFIGYGKLQLKYTPKFYGGIGLFGYYMWAPKGTICHQEDAAALLSPDLYIEFIKPCDRKIVDSFNGCMIHQHPTRYFPVDSYLAMNVTALELHIDEGGPSAEQLYDVHRNILERKPLLIWGNIPGKDLDWIFSKLPVEGLAVNTIVDSPEQAKDIWNKYIK